MVILDCTFQQCSEIETDNSGRYRRYVDHTSVCSPKHHFLCSES
jgi:hypothetical protein